MLCSNLLYICIDDLGVFVPESLRTVMLAVSWHETIGLAYSTLEQIEMEHRQGNGVPYAMRRYADSLAAAKLSDICLSDRVIIVGAKISS